jgi:hypothetical protein
MGRLILVNSIRDSQLIYTMNALQMARGTLDEVDRRRRRWFIWSGTDSVSETQCLVTWDKECNTRGNGSLGVKDLDTLSACLLLEAAPPPPHYLTRRGRSRIASMSA